jgi:hypothetical protein
MINVNRATKVKQNLDVVNETIKIWLFILFLFICFLNEIWLLLNLKEK